MDTRKPKYSIRKLSIGAASALIGVLLFISNDTAHASEQQNNTTTETATEQHTTTEQVSEKPRTSVKQDITDKDGQNIEEKTVSPTEENRQNTTENKTTEQYEQPETSENDQATTTEEAVDNKPQTTTDDKSDSEHYKVSSTADKSQQAVTITDTTQHNQDESTNSKDTDSTTDTQHQKSTSTAEHPAPKEDTVLQPTDKQQRERQQKQQSSNITADDANKGELTEEQPRETQRQTTSNDAQMYENNDQQRNNAQTSTKITSNEQTTNTYADTTLQQQKNIDRDSLATTNTRPVSLEEVGEPLLVHGSSRNSTPEEQKSLAALEANTQATRTNNTTQEATPITDDQPTKVAKQGQFKNEDPIILVHGFNGFTGDNKPTTEGNYWGGDKLSISQDLRDSGYETYEASVGALSSNYDRAVELYYYIKGGTVDYGAAHAAKYGHARYGRTYEGVYKDWQPGQQVHLVGHSMGGQTSRLLDTMLREGNQEEIAYQAQHGGEISPLFQGGNDDMITSVTTVGTPHNGTHAADQLGNEQLIRQIAYDYSKFQNNKWSQVDYGFSQWGLKQRPNETYIDYVKRVKAESNIWLTDDNGFYDLTRQGAAQLNEQTSLDPNAVYKTYTGESTRASITGRQVSDINMNPSFRLTGNVIGKAAETEWRENDGLVSVVSAQHPFNQDFVTATDNVQKGVWQVTPVKHDWDHEDFIGSDVTQSVVTTEELQQFWHGIAADLVRNENIAAQA
ncbi:YSIRK-type signal peptide-containing protein [Staphylococcus arlettae]|uniref:YSIRK-targeted triacylglycerol lipase n=1 Tax=Staphylococcus arlettae TaxID=29378 RepID=UPI002DBE060F|nr:YSIRK-type signal peptide-containing protein [Staphylococcus arlettae]MEB7421544.1 YSIRK-type signal peptide-containing protein [Staphylococcus arlettae]